jgi:hypothetical protein
LTKKPELEYGFDEKGRFKSVDEFETVAEVKKFLADVTGIKGVDKLNDDKAKSLYDSLRMETEKEKGLLGATDDGKHSRINDLVKEVIEQDLGSANAGFSPKTRVLSISSRPIEELNAIKKRDFNSGWSITKTIDESLVHELGHAISLSAREKIISDYVTVTYKSDTLTVEHKTTETIEKITDVVFEKFKNDFPNKLEMAESVSGYAKVGGPAELVAESFADVTLHGKNAKKVSKEIVRELKKQIKWKY